MPGFVVHGHIGSGINGNPGPIDKAIIELWQLYIQNLIYVNIHVLQLYYWLIYLFVSMCLGCHYIKFNNFICQPSR